MAKPIDPKSTQDVDLCVIGAGLSGLNVLAVAMEYLPKGARVVIVDSRADCGGMWNTAYDYVRLHQPHGMFTAADMPWRKKKPRAYLADRAEVRAHLRDCFAAICAHFDVLVLFGYRCEASAEVEVEGRRMAVAECTGPDGKAVRIRADRLVWATGFDVPVSKPLPVTSQAVQSLTPETLGAAAPGAPVYLVGGGKTAMDTAAHLLRAQPGQQVHMITGRGTLFWDRASLFPTGLGRLWRGTTALRAFGDLAGRFDGDNEEAVLASLKERYTLSLDPEARDLC